MTSKAMWEVDPETRSKLSAIQKKEGSGNDKCADCGAPSPQWASPKFSTFICLTCAGTHRGLGVHVSFIRSVSMDAFKTAELLRMSSGGNRAWQNFYNATSSIPFDEATIKERYDCEVGEEWKERLSCIVEGRDFDKTSFQRERAEMLAKRRQKEVESGSGNVSRSGTPVGRVQSADIREGGPARQTGSGISIEQKERNEAYFAKMGAANADRPEGLAPSQGGKYAGFGSSVPEPERRDDGGIPSADEFTKDPVTALTKGFGWFGGMVSKQAKMVNESYIQPTAKNIVSSDFAAQAKTAALSAGAGIQSGAKGAAVSLNKFIEGQDERAVSRSTSRVEPEKKDFWDSFGAPVEKTSSGSLGTNALRKGNSASGTVARSKDDGWGDDW